MSDTHELFRTWEIAARELVLAGYERREYRNPAIPATFHKNGEVVYLLLDDNNQWRPKPLDLKEPMMF